MGDGESLYSMDRWFMNPYEPTYQPPQFHTETMADLNVVPQGEYLEFGQLENYFYQVKDKIQNYIGKLEELFDEKF